MAVVRLRLARDLEQAAEAELDAGQNQGEVVGAWDEGAHHRAQLEAAQVSASTAATPDLLPTVAARPPAPPASAARSSPPHTSLTEVLRRTIESTLLEFNRPRKILGWRTPAEVFDEQLRLLQKPGVATTG